MKKSKLFVMLMMSVIFTSSCAKKKTDDAAAAETAPVASDGSLTAAILAGSSTVCAVFSGVGTGLTGKAYTRYLSLSSSGSYNYSIYFSDATVCSTSQNAGGGNIATYSQTGTFAVSGLATGASTTATQITFSPSSFSMTIRPGTYSGDPVPGAFRDWLNGSCTPTPGFTAGAVDSTKSVADLSCVGSASYNFPSFPFTGSQYSNIIHLPGNGTLQLGTRDSHWAPGALGTTYPTSLTETWLNWH